jgi:hypothetical protein
MAFLVAALAYRQSILLGKKSQARLVYAKITDITEFEEGDTLEPLPNSARVGNGSTAVAYVPDDSGGLSPVAVRPGLQLTVKVHNGSAELISPIKLQLVDLGLRSVIEDTSIVTSGPVEPGADYVVCFTIENSHYPGSPSLGAKLLFRDASGRWWSRYLLNPVEEVHDDPENYSFTPAERAGFAENARRMGLEPSAEPKIPWRVRLRRFRRTTRGKKPIP